MRRLVKPFQLMPWHRFELLTQRFEFGAGELIA
jgi:hypothetical protein